MYDRDLERAQHYTTIGFYQQAVDAFNRLLALNPGHPQLLSQRAENYIKQGRFDEAVRDYNVVVKARPNDDAAWMNFGLALQCTGEYEAALVAYDHSADINPKNKFAYFNKGVCLERDLGRTGEGVPFFEKALELDPGFHSATGGLSFNKLITGDFLGGWQDFEYRNLGGVRTILPGLQWNGKQTTDKLVLVCEQGLGDNLQFCRYALVAAMNGQKTAIYAPKEFHSLLSSLGHGVELLGEPHEIVEPYQWLPMMSMPRLMGTTVITIPAIKSYLHSSPEKIKFWREEMASYEKSFKIGICWHPGHPQNPHVAGRVIPLRLFADIAAIPNVQLFSLQKEEAATEIETVDFNVIDMGGDPLSKKDLFMDAAAIIDNLDLVISTDTAILHMAGAVGCKTFAMLPKGGCWRWLLNREDTPWYPAMRLFRAQQIHDWPGVLDRIKEAVIVERDLKNKAGT